MAAGVADAYAGTSDRTSVLADAGREAGEAPDLIALGRLIVGAIRKAVGADGVLVCGRTDDDVRLIVAHGASAHGVREFPMPVSAGHPVSTVVRLGREVWSGPASTAEAIVPVRDGSTTLGALVVAGHERRSFDNDERAFLRALADTVAPAWARLVSPDAVERPPAASRAPLQRARTLVRDIVVALLVPVLVALPFALSSSRTNQFAGWAMQLVVVVIVALWFGRRAGMIAAAASTISVWFILNEPHFSFRLASNSDRVGVITFSVVAVVALALIDRFRETRQREETQRSRLETLVHDAPIGIAVHDHDLKLRAVNPTMAVMDDRPLNAHLNRRWADLSPVHAALIEPYLAAVRDSGTAIVDEPLSLMLPEPGVERHWIASFFPLSGSEGDADEIAATFVDVTAEVIGRQRRLQLLRLAETIGGLTRLDEVAQAAADFCAEVFECRAAIGFVTSPDELEMYATSGFDEDVERRWVHRRVPLEADTPITDATRTGELIEVPTPGALAARYPTMELHTGEEACISMPLRLGALSERPSGALHLSWTHPRTLTSASMETLRTLATLTETVAFRLRVAEQVADERFKSALEAMTGTVAITRAVRDDHGTIVDFVIEYINQPEATSDRRPAADFIGETISTLYPDWLTNGRFDQLAQVVETGIPLVREGAPYTDVRADGQPRQGYSTFQVVRFDEGYLLSWHDVTDSVMAEQRARQLSVERSRREAVDALARLTTRLAAATTNREVARAACENAADAASADFVGIALVTSPDDYELCFSTGLDTALAPPGANLSMHDDTPFAVALRRGTPISIEWLPDFVTHRAALVQAMVDAGLRSVAFVPLRGEDDALLGALAFAWNTRREAAEGVDDPRVATVVDVVTTSLQRGAAEEVGRRRRAQADAMSELAAALAGAVGPDDVWRIATRHVPTVFGASRLAIARLSDDDADLLVTFMEDAELPEPWPTLAFPMDRPAPLTDAVRSKHVVVLDGPADLDREYEHLDQHYEHLATPAGREWGGIAAVPVVGTERVLGVVGIGLPPRRGFDDHERSLLEFVGSLLGQAATRAELYDRERARRRMIEAFQRASVEVLAAPDADPARAIARAATAILGAQRFVVYVVDGAVLRLLDSEGHGIELRGEVPLDERHPPTDAVLRGEPVTLGGAEDWEREYPHLDRYSGDPTLALPLHNQAGAVACVIGLGFGNHHRFPTGLLESVPDMAAHWSSLYQRARAAKAERDAAQREHTIAVSLQHAMLGRPDDILHAEWSVAYKPADGTLEVGGDWYDLIDLDDDCIGLVVGDIVGHHLGAAAAMGQVRSAVRALAPTVRDPATLLSHVDGFIEHIEGAQCATIVYAVLDGRTGELSYSCAGHLPPLLVSPDGNHQFLLEGRNVPLGGFVVRPRTSGHITMKPDQTLVLYSDGLVERRGESVDVGMDRLATAATELAPRLDVPALCSRLVSDLLSGVEQRDDVAVLAVRPIPDEIHISRPADPATLRPTRLLLRSWLRTLDAASDEIDELVLSAGEALTNAIEHANPVAVDAQVFLDAVVHQETVTITIRDRGQWRPPKHDNPERGRGIAIMRAFNDVDIVTGRAGTTVQLRRRLRRAKVDA